MEMIINAGQSLSVTAISMGAETKFIFTTIDKAVRRKPGPSPRTNVTASNRTSKDHYADILHALRNGPKHPQEMRQKLNLARDDNPFSFALVELQNNNRRRRGGDGGGPIVKLADGRYALRENTAQLV